MKTLETLVQDLFADPKLTNDNLRGYSDDHLLRMSVNNPGGIYTPLITATATVYGQYFGHMTDLATKEAIRQNLTVNTNEARELVLDRIRTVHGLVIYRFGAESGTYEVFYPGGLTEYSEAKMDNLTTLLVRFKNAAVAHLNVSDPDEVTAIIADILIFTNARTAQRTVFAEEDMIRTDRNLSRKLLTRQLTRNLLIIAADMVDDPDGFNDYYDTTFLPRSSSSGTTDDGTLTGTVAPGATANISKTIAPGSALIISNTGGAKLLFCLAATDTDICTAGLFLNPGETRTITTTDLDPILGTNLNVTNGDLVAGSYSVTIAE